MIFNNDYTNTRGCTQIHEQSHMDDWKKRYGDRSCMRRDSNGNAQYYAKGKAPTYVVGNIDFTTFRRASECKAYRAGLACKQEMPMDENVRKGIANDERHIKINCND